MIEASFGSERTRDAAVHGAYQYDSGQRIRLHGLPSPEELAERDDFLSGDVVTVQAQFAYAGDSQTEARLASWDEREGVWIAAVPDAYLRLSVPVTVYVYVSYGASEESSRAKTCYEAMFTPIGRPAPGDQVTPDQLNAWDGLVAEVNLTLAGMNSAISSINAASARADAAARDAQAIADKMENLTVEAQTLPYTSAATADISDTGESKHIVFGIPQGKPGVFTLNGKTPDENGAVTLTASDVGAYSGVQIIQATLTANGWTSSSAAAYAQTVSVTGAQDTDEYDADVDMSSATASSGEGILEAWGLVGRIQVNNGSITAYAYSDRPGVSIPVRLRRIV